MEYSFKPKDSREVAREKLNSPENISSRGGEYVIPFVSSLEPEDRVHEQYGHLLQEKHRLKNLCWIESDLEKCLLKWGNFYKHNCLGSSRNKGRYTNKEGKFFLENLWNGFLDYSGGKTKYRMRLKKTAREVLTKQLKISVDWTKESGDIFPIQKIEEKLKSKKLAIAKTRKDILETKIRLNAALVLLKEEYSLMENEFVDVHRVNQLYKAKVRNICAKAEGKLNGTIKNPQK